jgi:Mg2+ and Co2+ transporter CorA
MTNSRQQKIQFDNFVWIDICQPDKESLDKIAEECYFLTLGVMAIIAIVIFLWFKRKKIL